MTEANTIHLVRSGGKDGEKAVIWCGRYTGVNTNGNQYVNPSSRTIFRAVHSDDPNFGPTCGACKRSVGMLRTASLTNQVDRGQRYKQRGK